MVLSRERASGALPRSAKILSSSHICCELVGYHVPRFDRFAGHTVQAEGIEALNGGRRAVNARHSQGGSPLRIIIVSTLSVKRRTVLNMLFCGR